MDEEQILHMGSSLKFGERYALILGIVEKQHINPGLEYWYIYIYIYINNTIILTGNIQNINNG